MTKNVSKILSFLETFSDLDASITFVRRPKTRSVPKRDMLPWWRQIDWVEKKNFKKSKIKLLHCPFKEILHDFVILYDQIKKRIYDFHLLLCFFLSPNHIKMLTRKIIFLYLTYRNVKILRQLYLLRFTTDLIVNIYYYRCDRMIIELREDFTSKQYF